MISLDITSTLGKAITPSYGIPEQDLTGLRTSLRRHCADVQRERAAGEHAWSADPYDTRVIEQVKRTARAIHALRPQTVVWIGIGGSGLGPKVIQEAFEREDSIEFLIIDTIDPAMLRLYMDILDWKKTFVIVASKSGDTVEPMSVFYLLWEKLQSAQGKNAPDWCMALTDPIKGTLHEFCAQHGIQRLPIPTAVGGRYSIFTPVGLLPLALLDGDTDAFVRGAQQMDEQCRSELLDDNPAQQLAAVQFLLESKRGCALRVIMPYIQRLRSAGAWNQQLIAESLGKREVGNPFPVAAIGTQDQHSLLQQWMAGPRKCWHLFIREEEKPRLSMPENIPAPFAYLSGKTFGQILDACYEGTARALSSAKRPHATITLPRLNEESLGQLFFLFLMEVVLLGKLYRIDPYGQPAVEVGKTIAKQILERGRID
jgi:glucose-6-phosphate isomerase